VAGGVLDQHPVIMQCLLIAWRLWIIDGKGAPRHTSEDIEFVRKWALDNG